MKMETNIFGSYEYVYCTSKEEFDEVMSWHEKLGHKWFFGSHPRSINLTTYPIFIGLKDRFTGNSHLDNEKYLLFSEFKRRISKGYYFLVVQSKEHILNLGVIVSGPFIYSQVIKELKIHYGYSSIVILNKIESTEEELESQYCIEISKITTKQ